MATMSEQPSIRVKSVCVFRDSGRVLLEKGFNPSNQQSYYMPPGGAVEFGERTADAVRREIREEFQVDITDVRLLGTFESFFPWGARPIHEIVFVFDGRFLDSSFYRLNVVRGHEAGAGAIEAFWCPIRELHAEPLAVYPEGLVDLLISLEPTPS